MTGIHAQIIADSINPADVRLTSYVIRVPKWMLAELNTHRSLSKSSSSSRARPIRKVLRDVWQDPFIPIRFGRTRAGMQAAEDMTGWRLWLARKVWLFARFPAVFFALLLLWLGLHKQWANRILEPWCWAEVVVSGTDWKNFFRLRCHPAAQPEFALVADLMLELYMNNKPRRLQAGEWHCAFADKFTNPQTPLMEKKIISGARCARASYQNHLGGYDYTEDFKTYQKLIPPDPEPKHFGALEHAAEALATDERVGNFRGWRQHRKEFVNENGEGTDLNELLRQRRQNRVGKHAGNQQSPAG